ncbi:glycoprotein endopeptidase metalloprotease [Polynucleobacter yangtzensis]|uniref:Glycoprotein endopeptidase metalloprotease n=1 Tax=Polynucleobacter yangtzensis TaxID=1743159 RepID=A0A9C7CAN7_9BURK|nr:ABC transporter permease [Polynucleobacter yangtzensis]BDT77271.1 glycoprotein endopeptidase metalloprotease [Polynucleobacter yangtzensis]
MSISDTISDVSEAPVAVWSQIEANSAKVSLSGIVNVYSLGGVWTQIRDAQDAWLKQGDVKAKTLTVDSATVGSLDGAGIAFLIAIEEAQINAGAKYELSGLDPRYQPLLKEFDPISNLFPVPAVKPKRSFVVSTGMAVQNLIDDTVGLITFTGHLFSDLVWSVRNPKQVRWGDFINAAVEAGIAALPIVGLVAFLIGVILSFQAAIGMQQFGAVSFVGPLAALGIVREMGPLITAILLAGRSSAAFAAEIGTMTVNSEVDALVSGGLSPIRFLVVPRVLAGILVAPILTLFADIVSIFSSMLTMLIYGIPFVNFYNGMLSAVDVEDILSGLLKATLFGVVVSAMGCLRGMQTGTGAAAVGISATRAVVSSIVMIVIVDGIFAFISYKTGF